MTTVDLSTLATTGSHAVTLTFVGTRNRGDRHPRHAVRRLARASCGVSSHRQRSTRSQRRKIVNYLFRPLIVLDGLIARGKASLHVLNSAQIPASIFISDEAELMRHPWCLLFRQPDHCRRNRGTRVLAFLKGWAFILRIHEVDPAQCTKTRGSAIVNEYAEPFETTGLCNVSPHQGGAKERSFR